VYFEEKVHGTSGRIGHVLCSTRKRWWQFWKPAYEWLVLNGTRRVDSAGYHIPQTRKLIEDQVAPHLRRGEEIYFEIFGKDLSGKEIQKGFSYGLSGPMFMLYRVTITLEDGKMYELNRKQVYSRALELGMLSPYLLAVRFCDGSDGSKQEIADLACKLAQGRSNLDKETLLEGVVVWFSDIFGVWTCLKHKSEEFLILESKQQDAGQDDVEDML